MSDIEAPDVPGEEHEHEACPSRDEKRASDAARQRVHGQRGESQTAEIGHVVCGDLARDERDEAHALWPEAPQPAHSAAHVASGIADDVRAEVRGEWPRDENCDYAVGDSSASSLEESSPDATLGGAAELLESRRPRDRSGRWVRSDRSHALTMRLLPR